MEKTRLGKGEQALRKLISPTNGSTSIIGNYILVDRQIHAVGFQYNHALMITKNTETYDETEELYVSIICMPGNVDTWKRRNPLLS